MASIFQKLFDRFKQNTTSGNPAYTTTLKTPSVKAPEAPASLSISVDPTSPLYTKSTSRTLTNSNSIEDLIKQINETNTSADISAQQNFNINKYLGGVKRGLQDLNGGQIESGDVSKFTDMRPENPYEAGIGRGLDKIEQFTDPNSDVYKTTFNRALDRYDATAAATNMSQSMRIANNNNLSDSAKRVAGAELNRVTQSNRAALTGDLTEQVNKMMFDAAKEFTTQSLNAADYEEGKFKTDADLAMREMTNRISTLQLEGQLSITEAQMAYTQVNDTINNKYKDIANQFQKMSLLANTTLQAEQFKLQAEQVYTQMFDVWAEKSVNRLIEMKNSNGGTITLDQVKNDPLTMSYLMKEMEMNGYEGNVDDYIQSRIDSSKTQVQIDQESVNALKQTFLNSGMDEETATAFSQYYSQLKNGAVQNDDGTWFVPGADGKPIMTWDGEKFIFDDVNKDDYENEIPTTPGKTYPLNGKLYQVGEDGKGVEIQNGAYYTEGDIVYVNNNGVPTTATTPSELWGAAANSIIGLGDNTKIYDELMTKRRAAITSGEIPAEDIYNDSAKLAIAKELAQPVVIESASWNRKDGRLFAGQVPKVNTSFIYNGKTYIASSGKYMRGKDNKEEAFDAIDAATGDIITIRTYALPSRGEQEATNKSVKSDTVEDISTIKQRLTETQTESNTENTTGGRPKRNSRW